MAPNNSFVLKTNLNPSFTLSHVLFSPLSFNGGFGLSPDNNIKKAVKMAMTTATNAPVIPK